MRQHLGLPNPVTSSSVFRRRRTLWLLLICIILTIAFFSSSSSPSSRILSVSPIDSLDRGVLELHALQHFVFKSTLSLQDVLYKASVDRPQGVPVRDRMRNAEDQGWAPETEQKRLDPEEEINLKVYSSFDGDDNWVKHVKELQATSPLVIFSKSYCPYSIRAIKLIQTYALAPPPRIVEVDLREDGDLLKVILTRLTEHSTFPNVILRGRSLGGADNLQALHDGGKLKDLFESNGLSVYGSR